MIKVQIFTRGSLTLDSGNEIVNDTKRIMNDILELYKIAQDDPKLRQVAFTATVNYVEKILNVSHRTSELLVSAALEKQSH